MKCRVRGSRATSPRTPFYFGARARDRTWDLPSISRLLYQLSYARMTKNITEICLIYKIVSPTSIFKKLKN